MAVSLDRLAAYVGSAPEESASLAYALETAIDLLDGVLETTFRPVPESVRDELVLEVAHEVIKRKDSPSGNSQFADFSTGQPVAAPRDPLQRVWPIVRRYVLPI